jgi:hypothetical protein
VVVEMEAVLAVGLLQQELRIQVVVAVEQAQAQAVQVVQVS